jgi:hypothetical protein
MVVGAVALVAALVAATAGAHPSGSAPADVLQVMALAGVVVLAATRARRWALVVGSTLVAVFGAGMWIAAGCAALALSAFLITDNRRDRRVGAVVGGLVTIGALHLTPALPTGLPSVAGAVACGVLLASGYRRSAPDAQQWCRRSATALVVAAAVALALAAYSVVRSRGDLDAGVDAARGGIDAASSGDLPRARGELERAAEHFDRADGLVGSVLLGPASWIPGVGPNVRMLQAATRSGARLTSSSARDLVRLDYDRLRRPEGGIDLATLASFRRPVHELRTALLESDRLLADRSSPWLVDPVTSRTDELRSKTHELLSTTSLAATAVDRAPALLGADGPRRYLVLLGNPAELRDLGGHAGNWAELVVDRGAIRLGEVGTPDELAGPAGPEQLDDAASFPPSLIAMRPTRFPQNWGSSPDLPTVTRLASELFGRRTGRPIDGVMYADPEAFAAFLSLTGPMRVPATSPPMTLDARHAARFLTHDQYVDFATETAANDSITQLVHDVFERLTHTRLPAPRELGELFGPLTREGRIQLASTHAQDQPLLSRLDLDGAVPDPDRGDLLGVISRNANPSKIDSFLRRSTTVNVRWDPRTGDVASTVRVRVRNVATAAQASRLITGNVLGLAPGTNVTDLAVLTPFDLLRASIDGHPHAVTPEWEGRYWRHSARLTLPPGATQTVQFELEGSVRPGPRYRMALVGQPLLRPGPIRLTIRRPNPDSGSARKDLTVGTSVTSEARDARLHFDIRS